MFPVADFEINAPVNPCDSNCKVEFKNKSEGADYYFWNFGDGSTSREAQLNHVYAKPGRYIILLQAHSTSGIWSEKMLELNIASLANSTRIISYQIVQETANQVIADVTYFYSGDQGADNIFMSLIMANNGKPSGYFGYGPGRVAKGKNTTRCTLSVLKNAPKNYTTNQLEFGFYIGGKDYFHKEYKNYNKVWNQLEAANNQTTKEDCIPFNPANVSIAPYGDKGQYRVIEGNSAMLLCPNKAEAERIVEIIKHYKLSQQCFVGRPDPSFSYWLASGHAPAGTLAGEDCIAFNPATIEVKAVEGRWKIVDGSHWMFDFAGNEAEARETFAIIKKYGFNKTCYVGRPDPSMVYLKK